MNVPITQLAIAGKVPGEVHKVQVHFSGRNGVRKHGLLLDLFVCGLKFTSIAANAEECSRSGRRRWEGHRSKLTASSMEYLISMAGTDGWMDVSLDLWFVGLDSDRGRFHGRIGRDAMNQAGVLECQTDRREFGLDS